MVTREVAMATEYQIEVVNTFKAINRINPRGDDRYLFTSPVSCNIIIEKNTFHYVWLPLGSLDVVVVSVLI